MNDTITVSGIREFVAGHLNDVFETMLSLKAEPGGGPEGDPFVGEHVSGSVGLAGETVNGSVYLHFSAPFARQAAAAMLGLGPEEITNVSDVNDVVGEVTNMVGGALKSWMCDAGATCVLTTPAVIRGDSFSIRAKPGVELIPLGFTCAGHRGLVEIHVKLH
jgi:chemotaxis protein CheX